MKQAWNDGSWFQIVFLEMVEMVDEQHAETLLSFAELHALLLWPL